MRHNEDDIDDKAWGLLIDRLNSIEKKVDDGFKTMNGRVRFTEKMAWTAVGGVGVISIIVTVLQFLKS